MTWAMFERVLKLPFIEITLLCISTLCLDRYTSPPFFLPSHQQDTSYLFLCFPVKTVGVLNILEEKQEKEIRVGLILCQLKPKADYPVLSIWCLCYGIPSWHHTRRLYGCLLSGRRVLKEGRISQSCFPSLTVPRTQKWVALEHHIIFSNSMSNLSVALFSLKIN